MHLAENSQLMSCCEHGYKYLGCIEGEEFLDQLSNSQLNKGIFSLELLSISVRSNQSTAEKSWALCKLLYIRTIILKQFADSFL
jgi:hypothetical protein